ncbi:hypothetical protein [Streptomyces sp. NPDC050485]|uniref:hypothetical protein n=1 Tax=Streptomyces sp. NPDC050485 TaxID=3365617 RepID=UPI00379D0E2E
MVLAVDDGLFGVLMRDDGALLVLDVLREEPSRSACTGRSPALSLRAAGRRRLTGLYGGWLHSEPSESLLLFLVALAEVALPVGESPPDVVSAAVDAGHGLGHAVSRFRIGGML